MYNKITLVGNLTRDIELRYTQGGSAIGSTGIATNRKWKSQTGEQKEEVMFVDITFFGRSAEIANQYLRKGSKILVDGRLKLEQWNAQDGSKRSKHSVTVETMKMLDGNPNNQGGGNQGGYQNNNNQAGGQNGGYQNNGHQNNGNQNNGNQNNGHQNNGNQNNRNQNNGGQGNGQPDGIPEIDINEDEIPF